jgi:hypothetical protein
MSFLFCFILYFVFGFILYFVFGFICLDFFILFLLKIIEVYGYLVGWLG